MRLGRYDFVAVPAPQWGMLALIVLTQLIAAFVLLRRPAEASARALFVFVLGTWSYATWVQGTQVIDIANGAGYWLYRLPSNLLFLMIFAAWLHLALVFPRRHPVLERHPRLLPGIYLLPYLLFWLFMAAMRPLLVNTLDWLGRWAAGEWLVAAIFLLPTMGLMVQRYRRA